MTESTETESGKATFAELFDKGPKAIKEGEIAKGIVLSIDSDFVQVDVGFKSEDSWPRGSSWKKTER